MSMPNVKAKLPRRVTAVNAEKTVEGADAASSSPLK
jgi:hypothetical protein